MLIYAYLSMCYELFYGRLGVDANDVGLSYAGVLARSTGFVVVYLVFTALLTIGVVVANLERARERHERDQQRRSGPRTSRLTMVAVVAFAILIANSLRYPLIDAGDAARDVQAGRPVGPVRYGGESNPPLPILQLPLLAIHADPAAVEPAGKPGDAPAAERLHGRKVLYLGQASGTVVLYDPAVQQAVYVPASSIILHVSNCNAEPPSDSACSRRQQY